MRQISADFVDCSDCKNRESRQFVDTQPRPDTMKSGSRPTVITEFGGGRDVAIGRPPNRLVFGRPHELASSEWTTRAGNRIAAFLSLLGDNPRATVSHGGGWQINHSPVFHFHSSRFSDHTGPAATHCANHPDTRPTAGLTNRRGCRSN